MLHLCKLAPRFGSLLGTLALLLIATPLLAQPASRSGPFAEAPRSLRSRQFDQLHLKLELDFDFQTQSVSAKATHRIKLFESLQEISFDAAEMKIKRVELKSTETTGQCKFEHRAAALRVELPNEVAKDTELEIQVVYEITKPKHGIHFVRPDEEEPTSLEMLWTQSEPEYARYWFPCFDHPSDRLTSEIIATVPTKFVTLSNGILVEKKEIGEGRTMWHWSQQQSHVAYLLSIVAGDFEIFEQKYGDLPVQSYVPRGRLADAPRSFEKTPAMVDFFSKKIGVGYPWPKYTQICVDEYNWGGMEHTSATTLNLGTLHDERAHLDVSSDGLVAHELAHQWWGDLVTCKDWAELWLNESFATYFANLWTEHDLGPVEATWERYGDGQSYLQEDRRYRRPIVTYRYRDPGAMFDRHSYPKGGRVLHMLREELGEENFWRGIKRYCELNQHRAVETADLRIAMEEATGRGLTWFFDQWAMHGGHPELTITSDYDSTAKSLEITIKQTQKVDELTPLFKLSAEIEIGTGSESSIRKITIDKAEQTFHFDVASRPTRVVFDPRDVLLKVVTHERSNDELLDVLAHSQHIIPRHEAVASLEQQIDDQDVLAALVKAAKSDPFWAVRMRAAEALAKTSSEEARKVLVDLVASDPKSSVRRMSASSLAKYAHDEARAALRSAIEKDPSYEVAATSIRSLVKIDAKQCRELLLASCERESHRDVILKAAVDGLVELKDQSAITPLAAMLDKPLASPRRTAIIIALAKLDPTSDDVMTKLEKGLASRRSEVRRASIDAVAELGQLRSIKPLEELRSREERRATIESIDEAIGKIRSAQNQNSELVKQVERLQKETADLQRKLEKIGSNPENKGE
ncbi:Peptidase M1 membrane alanine aminopeptidase [Pirellula staleyi DSM 6068]|uniref:Aminopeptidase N n=1 Tax=Pirellula staleyi (strain ATCC 27377 / DSM 6068 / ICPB 4128) TaxID=530564 RepID=D2QYP0_PIRSD|nr:M1 family aminopeptidase [Pirellula staleyi]ADB18199.1 Peptidase M1 membrane alanine aminopeptidase [Pirellula staleyi DSM 6068]